MKRPPALARCLQHLQTNHQRCLRKTTTSTTGRLSSRIRLRTSYLRPSSRAFSTISPARQDLPQRPLPQHSTTRDPSSPQQRAPPRLSPDDSSNRIDLSTVTTNPNYRAPIRSQASPQSQPQSSRTSSALGASTLASIDALIAKNRARSAAGQQKSQSQGRTTYNEDLYGKGGSIFQRTGTAAPGGARSSVNPFDVSALLRNLDTPAPGLAGTKPLEPILRLKPTLGKTIDLDDSRNFGLTRAFQVLETRINKNGNNVRGDLMSQKFHVRRGQARKIHRRMRWRVVFKEGFLGECGRVRRMIRQGW